MKIQGGWRLNDRHPDLETPELINVYKTWLKRMRGTNISLRSHWKGRCTLGERVGRQVESVSDMWAHFTLFNFCFIYSFFFRFFSHIGYYRGNLTQYYFILLFRSTIEVQLIYNIVLVSGVQQIDLIICVCSLFHIFSIMVYHRILNISPCAVQ